MKLSRVQAVAAARTAEPVAQPSPVHVAFVEVLAELTRIGAETGHPAAKIMRRLVPSVLPDIAEVPAELLAKMCRRLGVLLVAVAQAEDGTAVPSLSDALDGEEEPADGPLPALPS